MTLGNPTPPTTLFASLTCHSHPLIEQTFGQRLCSQTPFSSREPQLGISSICRALPKQVSSVPWLLQAEGPVAPSTPPKTKPQCLGLLFGQGKRPPAKKLSISVSYLGRKAGCPNRSPLRWVYGYIGSLSGAQPDYSCRC